MRIFASATLVGVHFGKDVNLYVLYSNKWKEYLMEYSPETFLKQDINSELVGLISLIEKEEQLFKETTLLSKEHQIFNKWSRDSLSYFRFPYADTTLKEIKFVTCFK